MLAYLLPVAISRHLREHLLLFAKQFPPFHVTKWLHLPRMWLEADKQADARLQETHEDPYTPNWRRPVQGLVVQGSSPWECQSVQKNPPWRSVICVFGSAEDWGMHVHLQSSRCLEATLGQRQCPMRRHSVCSKSRGVNFLRQKKIWLVSTLLLLLFHRILYKNEEHTIWALTYPLIAFFERGSCMNSWMGIPALNFSMHHNMYLAKARGFQKRLGRNYYTRRQWTFDLKWQHQIYTCPDESFPIADSSSPPKAWFRKHDQ